MRIRKVTLASSIEEKIEWAETSHFAYKDRLMNESSIGGMLPILRKAIDASHGEMRISGIVEACGLCEEKEGGSCCGAGLENKYDGVLLLINVLLERNLPKRRSKEGSCFFLGESGCLLLARHVICLNYLCRAITERIDPLKLAALREKDGKELEILFDVHERIRHLTRPA
jgi:hypothetical protein